MRQKKILYSPFNYPEQSLLCVPRYLPNTNQVNTLNSLGEMLLPVIEANKGRCFVLCTSYSMMRGLAEYFRKKKSSFDFITRRNLKRQITRTIYKKKRIAFWWQLLAFGKV